MRLANISVDLDEIPNYFQIHGLTEPDDASRTLVYDRAVGRLLDFASAADIPITFFAIGADLSRPQARAALRDASQRGHEIANHSLDHMYDLTRLSRVGIRTQIEGGIRAIEDAIGVSPKGFRAPGYTITDEVFDVLTEVGVSYDSSVFPCPAYYAAKALAVGTIALRGRQSRSILDTPEMLRAPTRPYRVGRPYWKRGDGILEIPIQVASPARIPFIGTSVVMAGRAGSRMLAQMCVGEPLVNLELHGIDVLDHTDGLEGLSAHQPDVKISWMKKIEIFLEAVALLKRAGYAFVTLQDASAKLFA